MPTIRSSIDPTITENLETAMNATAKKIRSTNAATAKAALTTAAAEAAKTVTEKVTPTRKPRASKKVTATITPEDAARLATAAKASAEKLMAAATGLSDPKRVTLAEAKATAACVTANLRADEAGLPLPFPFGIEEDPATIPPNMDEPEVTARVAEKHLDAFGALKLTARQKALMLAIGRGEFSFFDNGIVAESGIWHSCLTGEAGTEIAANAHGVANVISALVRKGLLESSDLAEDGVWVELTVDGASLANSLAGATTKTESVPAPEPKVAPVAKPKTAKAAEVEVKAAKPVAKPAKAKKVVVPVEPINHPKVVALVEYAVAQGWVATAGVATAPDQIVVEAARDAERLTCTFVDAKLDLSNMPQYIRADGSTVLLRNVSAVKKQMDSDATARPVKATRSISKKVARIDGAESSETPVRDLPFDVKETSSEEIAEILAGATVTWRRTDGATETAIVGKKATVSDHPTKPGKAHRVASFFEIVDSENGPRGGGQRSVGIDRLLTVGK